MEKPSGPSSFRGIVTSPQCEPSEAAARVLREGGNAFDAAVAGAFVQGVVDPHRSGIGGFGVATLFEARTGKVSVVAFHGRAGSKVTERMWDGLLESVSPDGFGYLLKGKVNDVGHASIAVPGMVRGMEKVHAGRGKLPWAKLLAPAAALAEEGWIVTRQMHEYWRRPGLAGRPSAFDRISSNTASRLHAIKPDGQPYAEGERMRLPALAATYRRLAEAGPGDFYEGEIARTILRELEDRCLFDAKDLAAYRAEAEEPVRARYGGLELFAPGAPAGGIPLLQVLRLAERCGLARLARDSVEFYARMCGILARLHDARAKTVGDPRYFAVDADRLLSDGHLDEVMARPVPTRPPGEEPMGTTQLTIVDAEGNAASLNHSLGYGSGIFSGTHGFAYNNCMSCFDPRPGRPDSLAPGRARFTAVAPTVGLKGGGLQFVTGAPGAARITAAVAQVAMYLADYGLDPQAAVEEERFDAVGREVLFGAAVPAEVEAGLVERGWHIRRSTRKVGFIARVFPLWKTADGWKGGADPAESPAVVEA